MFFILNEKMKQKTKYIFQAILVIIAVVLVVLVTRSCSKPKTIEHTVELHDTITDIKWKTVTVTETKVEKVKVRDTVYVMRDSVFYVVDSVFADIPISCYQTDTVFENDYVKLKIGIECSGYDVVLDRLYYDLQYKYYTVQQPKKRHRLGFMVGPFIGVGYDPWSGKVVPAVGIGVGIGVSFKKW